MTSVDIDSPPETPITTRTLRRERVKVSQHVAAAIAHELRNPVFSIAAAAQLLRYRSTDDPIIERNLGRILREAERLNALVVTLLDYGRPAPVRLEPADPDDVWTDVLEANRGLLESKALLVQHRPANPRGTCAIDVEQLAQALGNALGNAVDAAPEGSDLTIESMIDGAAVWRSRLHNDGGLIPAETLARAFEPLVSAKPGHAGIGLAVAQRVVHEHGGVVALDSSEGAGTTFTVSLPLARLP